MNAALLLMIETTATMEIMDIIIMDVETVDRMDVANAIMTFVTLIMTMMINVKIIDRLLTMIATFTNILVIRTTNGKIVFLIQHQTHIKSSMNPFNDTSGGQFVLTTPNSLGREHQTYILTPALNAGGNPLNENGTSNEQCQH